MKKAQASSNRRFRGRMGDEYDCIRRVMPHFDELQNQVGAAVARLRQPTPKILEIGCGDGITTAAILAARPDAVVVALDHEPKMIARARRNLRPDIRRGRCTVVRADVLEWLARQPPRSFAAVASALTLHNLTAGCRARLHRQIYRVLAPGGLFVNADKYAPQGDAARFAALDLALQRFFRTFLPMKKFQLLEEWVRHNVADQGPDRVMKSGNTLAELRRIGFARITLRHRCNMEAVLTAWRK